jgi:hypothetical protein
MIGFGRDPLTRDIVGALSLPGAIPCGAIGVAGPATPFPVAVGNLDRDDRRPVARRNHKQATKGKS